MLVFSTHAFTEGDVLSSFFGWLYAISTHAFTEGDGVQLKRKFYWKRISTHAFTEGDISAPFGINLWPSTRSAPRVLEYECISTHAFTEGDVLLEIGILACNHFNSRLHGRRPVEKRGATISELFQLTPSRKATILASTDKRRWTFQLTPSRKATKCRQGEKRSVRISTHAFTEGDTGTG